MEFPPTEDGSSRKPTEAELRELNEKYDLDQLAGFYQNCLQEITDNLDKPEDQAFEEERFPNITRHLRLDSFKCFDDSKWGGHEGDPSNCYLSRTGLAPQYLMVDTKAGWRSAMFIRALDLPNLQSLHLWDVSSDLFDEPGNYTPLTQSTMPKLREFSLLLAYNWRIWRSEPLPNSFSSRRFDGFGKLLTMSTTWRIRSLALGLESFHNDMSIGSALLSDFESIMMKMLFRHHWPHLWSLELKYLYGGEEVDLFHWLLSHRTSLRTLHMARMMCLDHARDTNPFLNGCPAFFLRAIAKTMTLDQVSLGACIFRSQYGHTFRGGENVEGQVAEWWSEYMCHKAEEPMSISELEHIQQQQVLEAVGRTEPSSTVEAASGTQSPE